MSIDTTTTFMIEMFEAQKKEARGSPVTHRSCNTVGIDYLIDKQKYTHWFNTTSFFTSIDGARQAAAKIRGARPDFSRANVSRNLSPELETTKYLKSCIIVPVWLLLAHAALAN